MGNKMIIQFQYISNISIESVGTCRMKHFYNRLELSYKWPCVSASEVQTVEELGEDGWWSKDSPPRIARTAHDKQNQSCEKFQNPIWFDIREKR